jgi:hypothetical protein
MNTEQPYDQQLVEWLETNDASMEVQMLAANRIRQLLEEKAKLWDDGYKTGFSRGLHAACEAINEKFGL